MVLLFKQDTSRIKASNKNGDDSEIKQALLFHSHECRPWNPDLFYLFILMGGAHIFGIDACTRTGFSLTLSMLVFFLWNFVMLKRERKRYWAQAVFSYFGSVAFFAYFLT